jgi:hypothetical protein
MQKLKALEAAIEASLDKQVSLTNSDTRIGRLRTVPSLPEAG